jgi:hypothetical protein
METMMQAWRIPAIAVTAAVIGCLSGPVAAQLDSARDGVIQTTNEGRQSQDRIDDIASDTQEIVAAYRTVLRQIEDLRTFNDRQRALIQTQIAEMESIRQQTERVKTVEREIVPLMIRMTDALELFINMDIPFQLDGDRGRLARIATLRDTQSRADVALSEKFRLVLEAYQIESDFGRKIAYYSGNLGGEDGRTVDFLTVGRAAFYYQTRNGNETGIWNPQTKQWDLINNRGGLVRTAMDMAQEIIPPDLMILPVFGASEGESNPASVPEPTPTADGTDDNSSDGDDASSSDDDNSN